MLHEPVAVTLTEREKLLDVEPVRVCEETGDCAYGDNARCQAREPCVDGRPARGSIRRLEHSRGRARIQGGRRARVDREGVDDDWRSVAQAPIGGSPALAAVGALENARIRAGVERGVCRGIDGECEDVAGWQACIGGRPARSSVRRLENARSRGPCERDGGHDWIDHQRYDIGSVGSDRGPVIDASRHCWNLERRWRGACLNAARVVEDVVVLEAEPLGSSAFGEGGERGERGSAKNESEGIHGGSLSAYSQR